MASAGVTLAPPPAAGDLSDWLALMEVVEALCPHWPVRELCVADDYRL